MIKHLVAQTNVENIAKPNCSESRRGRGEHVLFFLKYKIDFLSHVRYILHVKHRGSSFKGDQLLAVLAALANPHRLRIIAALAFGGRNYVSQLARELGISRPLLHLHLQKLEDTGLVTSQMELSQDGKALNYFEVRNFDFEFTPASIAEAAKSLTAKLES